MIKSIVLAAAAALCLAGPARAGAANPAFVEPQHQLDLNLHPSTDGYADVLGVSTARPAAAVILTDALYGALIGAGIGTAIALINGNDYGRDIGMGIGFGILLGAGVGAVDVATRDQAMDPRRDPIAR